MKTARTAIATLVGAAWLSACVAAPEEAPLGAPGPVNAAIDGVVDDGAFPFLYVRVERLDGSLVYERSAANPDFAAAAPTGETWMRLWSMTKTVTIAAILSLEEDGVLSRTDPVTDYIPEFAGLRVLGAEGEAACDAPLRAPRRAMTIEDLLNHTDGFYYPFTGYDCLDEAMRAARLPEAASSEDAIARISGLALHPGGLGEYNYGIGTLVLGLVAERATGMAFDAVVEAHITAPLGLTETLRYTLPEGVETAPQMVGADGALRLARPGELDIFGGPVPDYAADTRVFLAGEGMVGTPEGYTAFLRMMGNLGALGGARLLEEDTVRDWYAPKTQLDSPYGHNGFNIWVTSGQFDDLPDQKPGLLVGGGYEGTAFWIDMDAGYVGLIMSQVLGPATGGVDEVSRLRGLIYEHILEPGAQP
ncbi:MAG: serine hydrolase domain-containing protein [Pseudomonadota bacterium]